MPRLRIRPGVRFGRPLDFSRYYGMARDRVVLRAVTDEIMYELMKLSGQEYVDEYAAKGKSRLQALRLGHHGEASNGEASNGAGPAASEAAHPNGSAPAESAGQEQPRS
jgi:1-acyl-sn-glycerol-3-phosphate acyltransferase